MRHNLTADMQLTEITVRGGGNIYRRYLLRGAALSLVILVFLSAGVAMASAETGPDSFLHPVKLGLEDLRTALTFDPASKADLEASHSIARLDEIETMVKAGKPEYVPSLLESYENHMENARRCADEAAAQGENIRDMEVRLEAIGDRHDVLLIEHADALTEQSQAAVNMAMQNSQYRKYENWQQSSNADNDAGTPKTGTLGASSARDNGNAGLEQAAGARERGTGIPGYVAGKVSGLGNGNGHPNGNIPGNGSGQSNDNNGQGNGNSQGNANGYGQASSNGQGNDER